MLDLISSGQHSWCLRRRSQTDMMLMTNSDWFHALLSLKLEWVTVINSGITTAAREQLDGCLSEVLHLAASSLPADMLLFWQQRSSTIHIQPSCSSGRRSCLCPSLSSRYWEDFFQCVEFCAVVVAATLDSRWRCTAVWNLCKFSVTLFFG